MEKSSKPARMPFTPPSKIGVALLSALLVCAPKAFGRRSCSFDTKEIRNEADPKPAQAAIVVCGDKPDGKTLRALLRIAIFTQASGKNCHPTQSQLKAAAEYCKMSVGPDSAVSKPMTFAQSNQTFPGLFQREKLNLPVLTHASVDYSGNLTVYSPRHSATLESTYKRIPLLGGLTQSRHGDRNLSAIPSVASLAAIAFAGPLASSLSSIGSKLFGKAAVQAAAHATAQAGNATAQVASHLSSQTLSQATSAAAQTTAQAATKAAGTAAQAMSKKVIAAGAFFNAASGVMQKEGEAWFARGLCSFPSGDVISNPLDQDLESAFFFCRYRDSGNVHSVFSLFPTTKHDDSWWGNVGKSMGKSLPGCRPTEAQFRGARDKCLALEKDTSGRSKLYLSMMPLTSLQLASVYPDLTTLAEDPKQSGGLLNFFKPDKALFSFSPENPSKPIPFWPISMPLDLMARIELHSEMEGGDDLGQGKAPSSSSNQISAQTGDKEDPFGPADTKDRSRVQNATWQACDFPTKKVQLSQIDPWVRPAFVACLDKNNTPLFKMTIFTYANTASGCDVSQNQLMAARKHCLLAAGKGARITTRSTQAALEASYPSLTKLNSVKSNTVRGASIDYSGNVVYFSEKHHGYQSEIFKRNLYEYGMNLNQDKESGALFWWTMAANILGLVDNILVPSTFIAQAPVQIAQSFNTPIIQGYDHNKGFTWGSFVSAKNWKKGDLFWNAQVCDFTTGKMAPDVQPDQNNMTWISPAFYLCMDSTTNLPAWVMSIFAERKATKHCQPTQKMLKIFRDKCLSQPNRWANQLGLPINMLLQLFPNICPAQAFSANPFTCGQHGWNKTGGTVLYNAKGDVVVEEDFWPVILDDSDRAKVKDILSRNKAAPTTPANQESRGHADPVDSPATQGTGVQAQVSQTAPAQDAPAGPPGNPQSGNVRSGVAHSKPGPDQPPQEQGNQPQDGSPTPELQPQAEHTAQSAGANNPPNSSRPANSQQSQGPGQAETSSHITSFSAFNSSPLPTKAQS